MSEANRERLWPEMMSVDGDIAHLVVERVTIQEGRTFSADAMEHLHDQFIVWVGTRLMRRWEQTGEPPTALLVEVRVVAS